MAEKILNTRIQLKYDSYTDWTTANTLLKEGEVAIVEIPGSTYTKYVNDKAVTVQNPPHVLMKVGPGNFNDLDWTSAKAADVHEWAKKSLEEFTAWVAKTPKTVTLSVNGEDTDYTIEEAIKLVRNEITAGGEAAAITIDDESIDGKIKYTAKQGGTAIVESIEINEGAGIEISVEDNVPKISHQAKPTEGMVVSPNAGTGRTYITQISTDEMGHITDIEAATETVTDTHHEAKNVVGASATAKTNAAATNGNVYLNLIENDTIRSHHNIKGAGTVAVTSDANGNITIAGTDTNVNTAHTHDVGDGLKQSSAGGISGEVKTELNLEFGELKDNKLQLLDKTSKEVIAEFDASEFVEDSYLDSVTYSDENGDNILEFVFKLNDGTQKTVDVDLSHLVDVYTADETSLTLTTSGDGKVFKIAEAGVETKHIKDANVTEAKLETSLAEKINSTFKEVQVVGSESATTDSNTVYLNFKTHENETDSVGFFADDTIVNIYHDGNDQIHIGLLSDPLKKATIGTLDVTDTVVTGQYVSSVSQTDGKITVTRAQLPAAPSYNLEIESVAGWDASKEEALDNYSGESISLTKNDLSVDKVGIVAGTDSAISVENVTLDGENLVEAIAINLHHNENQFYQNAAEGLCIKDHAVGAAQLKSDKDYAGEDAEVWVLNCGSATVNV